MPISSAQAMASEMVLIGLKEIAKTM